LVNRQGHRRLSATGRRPPPGLAADTLVSLLAIAFVGGCSALYSLAVGRWLGEARLGMAALALAAGLGSAQVAISGVGPATTRFAAAALGAGRDRAARSAVGWGVAAAVSVGAALSAALAATGGWWAPLVGLPEAAVVGVAALALTQSAYLGLKAALYGLGQVHPYARIEACGAIAFVAALAWLVTGTAAATLAPFLAANVVFIAVALPVVIRAHPHAALAGPDTAAGGRGERRAMASFAFIATLGSSAALARLNLAPLVTGANWPAEEVGLLQAAMSFLLVVLLLPRALELALFPVLSSAHGREDRAAFGARAEAALEGTALVLGVVAGVVLLLGSRLLVLLYGPPFASAAPALAWIAVAGWSIGLAVPAVSALSGSGAVAIPNVAAVLGLGASIVAWAWLVPASGADGAALGLAVGSVVNAVVPLAAASRVLGLRTTGGARVTIASAALLLVAIVAVRRLGAPPAATAAVYVCTLLWCERHGAVRLLLAPLRGVVA
jgi:O-antigen/teichoic acid export membrane protein